MQGDVYTIPKYNAGICFWCSFLFFFCSLLKSLIFHEEFETTLMPYSHKLEKITRNRVGDAV